MAKYALVENEQIVEVVDTLPESWRNISNLNVMAADKQFLSHLGWVDVVQQDVQLNPHTEILGPAQFTIQQDGTVLQHHDVLQKQSVSDDQVTTYQRTWEDIRRQRDALMAAASYRYERYFRNERTQQPQVDRLERIDIYMKMLADITDTYSTPDSVVWPVFDEIVIPE